MSKTLFGIGAYNFKKKGVIKWKKFGKIFQDMNGKYQISNLGRVKIQNYMNTKKEKITKGYIGYKGYYQVDLYKNGKCIQKVNRRGIKRSQRV